MEQRPREIPKVLGGESEFDHSTTQTNEPVEKKFSEKDQIAYLEAKDTNYVFLFGGPGCGKTAITSSIIYHLSNPDEPLGDIEEFSYEDDAKYEKTDLNLLSKIRNSINNRRFPDRTNVGSLTHVNINFVPKNRKKNHVPITFLEMSGEDLKVIEDNDGSLGHLPTDIDVFFKTDRNKVKMFFILVTSFKEAAEKDHLMVKFLDYIISKDPSYRDSKVLLLISQWDSYQGNKSVREFIEDNMKFTWRKIGKASNAFRYFTLGRIDMAAGENENSKPFIVTYDEEPAQKVFYWLYQAITGEHLLPWWKRFFK